MKRLAGLFASLAIAMAGANPLPSFAQDKRADAMREQVRRLQQAQKKAEAERAALVEEKEALAKDKTAAEDALRKAAGEGAGVKRSLAAARQDQERLRREVEARTKEAAELAERVSAVEARLADSDNALRSTQQKLNLAETERAGLAVALGKQRDATQSCEAKNAKLFEFGNELIDRYQAKGFWSTLVQKEPFTGIKRVEIENLMEEYREKLAEQRLSASERSAPAHQVP